MANPEHIARIKKRSSGVLGRLLTLRQGEKMDLSGSDLGGLDLSGFILDEANLDNASLLGTNLRGASLKFAIAQETVLQSANLSGANLTGANLQSANLRLSQLVETNLSGANLRKAKLEWSNLQSANLQRVDLRGASLQGTNLQNADLTDAVLDGTDVSTRKSTTARDNDEYRSSSIDLSNAKGLSQSQIDSMEGDTGTLLPPELKIPSHWQKLRVHDRASKVNEDLPIDANSGYPFIFLSYSRTNSELASRTRRYLKLFGIQCWWDEGIEIGGAWSDDIEKHLEASSAVLTLWTEASVVSRAVVEEARIGQSQNKLVHARLDDVRLPYGFGETQYANMVDWDGTFDTAESLKLAKALRRHLLGTPPPIEREVLAKASRVDFYQHDGRIFVDDKPLGAPTQIEDKVRLNELVFAQLALIDSVLEELSTFPENNDLDRFTIRLKKYRANLSGEISIWEIPDNSFRLIKSAMENADAKNQWNEDLLSALDLLIKRHQEIAPFVQKVPAPLDSPNAITPPQLASMSAEPDLAQRVLSNMKVLTESKELHNIAERTVVRVFLEMYEELREADSETVAPGEPEDRKKRAILQTMNKTASVLSAFTVAVSSSIAGKAINNPQAANKVLSQLEEMLEQLQKIF